MSEGIYEALRELLDCHPTGCKSTPEIFEILKILFTEDEAKVALGLGFIPLAAEDVAKRTDLDVNEVRDRLEALAQKGCVFAREKDGVQGYALNNALYLFEMPYRKGQHDEMLNRLTSLWKGYIHKVSKELIKRTPIYRVIPVQRKIEHSPEVLPFSKVYEMIDSARVTGVSHCPCREFSQNCDAPRETCMVFNDMCTFMVDRGFARYISKDEMKEKLIEFDKIGLVRQMNNTTNRLEFLCNCCPCCCLVLRQMTEFRNPHAFVRSAFIPVLDETKCNGCGTCATQRCPTKAIEMVEEGPKLHVERCIGCGLCASGCPNEARRMEKTLDVPEVFANATEWGMKVLQERGKLEAFMATISSGGGKKG